MYQNNQSMILVVRGRFHCISLECEDKYVQDNFSQLLLLFVMELLWNSDIRTH